jgi:hypothetical protein
MRLALRAVKGVVVVAGTSQCPTRRKKMLVMLS